MATLHALDIPDELYAQLQELAKAENSSVEAQVVKILQQALQTQIQPTKYDRRKNVLKMLEENIRNRRRLNPADFGLLDSTALIREDRDR
ncbi:hypothetical protein NIES2111_48660 [Nostoc sp. NIES-2111]|nr:hypothetical protein NIES2111_48660 [Nostoc sp. NIES-2111]